LKFARLPARPLLFIAPRGLITILLFLAIEVEDRIAIVGKPLIIQVILLTGAVLMLGLMFHKRNLKEEGV
jgi:potassium/hydrogen antiporter